MPKRKRISRFWLIAALFMAAVTLRALSAGFSYLPILDDSIQYINFQNSTSFWKLILQEGLFASRPMAAITDLFFVGLFRDALIVPVIFFSLMHGLSGALFLRLFEKRFGTGIGFAVLYALLPLGVEGTYWLSASSRIVPGLFFTALAAALLDSYMEQGGRWKILLYAPVILLSYSFYEQILVLSVTLSALQFLSSVRHTHRARAALWAIPMAAVYFAFTGIFSAYVSAGAMSARMELALPNSPWYFDAFLPEVLRQIGAAFLKGGARTLAVGFVRGLCGSLSFGGILCVLLAVGAGVLVFLLTRPTTTRRVTRLSGWGSAALWGFLLALAPVTPYFIIANPWFSLRATTASFVGAGILLDLLLRVLLRRQTAYAAVCGVWMTVCLIAGFSEVRDYREAARLDEILAHEILAHDAEMQGRVGILALEEFLLPEQNYAYHEHIASAGSSDWSLYGKLTAIRGEELDFSPVPLATKGFSFYHGWNTSIKRLSGYDQLWAWDADTQSLSRLTAQLRTGTEHDFDLYLPDGTLWGSVWEEDGYGYIKISEKN